MESGILADVAKQKLFFNLHKELNSENFSTLEEALEFIEDDELVEITPDAIRLRKKFLNEHDRLRYNKSRQANK